MARSPAFSLSSRSLTGSVTEIQGEGPGSARTSSSLRSFRLLFELGRGGMARVYLGESLGSGIQKLVVLKILNQELARDAAMRAAFLREAVLSGRMNHPNVVQVQEVLQHESTDVIVMEYIDGFSLSRIVQHNDPRFSVRLQLGVLVQMLAGLHYFHELTDLDGNALHGVHRDVSPHNVLVSFDGQAKVADFGIAKVNSPIHSETQNGLVKGKIHYMAPEQLLGEQVDRRADIFSAGVLLWEAVAQRRMWLGREPRAVMEALVRGEIPSIASAAPNAPRALLEVVERATAIDRNERYGTALEVLDGVERAMSSSVGIAPHREIADFMQQAFGNIRAIQQRSVNHALRHPDVAPLGMLDCWTAGHSAQRPHPGSALGRTTQLDESPPGSGTAAGLTVASELFVASDSVFPTSFSGLTKSGSAVEPAPPKKRGGRRALLGLGAAVLGLAVAAAALFLSFSPSPARPSASSSPAPSHAAAAASASSGGEASSPVEHRPRRLEELPAMRLNGHEPVRSSDDLDLEQPPHERPPRVNVFRRPRDRSVHSAASSAAPDCSPPYRLLATGIKAFKPECFPAPSGSSDPQSGKGP